MAKIMVVAGNPLTDSYSEALARAYQRGAEAGGHTVTYFTLAIMSFDPILREGYRREQPLEADLIVAREALATCDHLVLVFPLWCGDMPALLKGFIERVLQPDLLAARAGDGQASWRLFRDKSARVIMTMGMPGWFYSWYYGAHALKLLRRNILNFIGIKPVRATIHGMIEAVGSEKRGEWLRQAEALGRDGR
jgi:NAD(P)H dehydrogenase (quinone)